MPKVLLVLVCAALLGVALAACSVPVASDAQPAGEAAVPVSHAGIPTSDELPGGCFVLEMEPKGAQGLEVPRQVVCPIARHASVGGS